MAVKDGNNGEICCFYCNKKGTVFSNIRPPLQNIAAAIIAVVNDLNSALRLEFGY